MVWKLISLYTSHNMFYYKFSKILIFFEKIKCNFLLITLIYKKKTPIELKHLYIHFNKTIYLCVICQLNIYFMSQNHPLLT